ncbi:hypothetical protein [Kitasatospora acidiphila]|uniref:hypothetical protein n=1 Tax=Kitasatospora acidiphila TaxID=2567942 RepID=UPI003C73A6CE
MGTDIYGGIEVRDPHADEDWYEWEPWRLAMDLYPLFDGRNYTAFGFLFGVRNYDGWQPVAANRGLPEDASAKLRQEYEQARTIDAAVHAPSWVSWAELDRIDMSATPAGPGGVLIVHNSMSPSLQTWYGVRDRWPSPVLDRFGTPPLGATPADAAYGRWDVESTRLSYRRPTAADAVGPGTGWEHVFAVMRALSARFGEHGVRLVAYFD